ncbi:DUF6603 domain-containing protein [Thauera linaloolentis]|uniref:DUF6603 domain-containing protein n=1 Tax=Thauera linaloolentis TaxID=76112 RepID=UPI000319A6F4|nr:DUF6603 domain-containing protein [Thauera linaloolentis]MCM8564472.1 hypothetical protein [Thauera linaloolentis]
MQFDLALADLVRPYLLKGEATTWHAALSVIYVESYETASSADGTSIRGVARFSGNVDTPTFDPTTGTLQAGASNAEGHPRNQPDRREPWLDITDTRIEFALTIPRAAGQIVAAGVAAVPGSATDFQPVRNVLTALDAIPTDAPPSDYPGTGFTLDMILTGIEVRPPFLKPAKMEANGLLVPDESRPDVVFHLPRIKLRLSQGSDTAATLNVDLLSLGATGLDDPGDIGAAEMIRMEPAYAFIGDDRVVGFAFRTAFLDLSDGYTPPEVLDQFGFDESWTGLYLPEIRIFFAPNGAEDLAVNVGVENLLIGLGQSSGITGDFDVAVINQGSGELKLAARFFDGEGQAFGINRLSDTEAEARVPASSRMVIDVAGGRAPYQINARFDGADHAGNLHAITAAATPKPVTITVQDGSAPPKQSSLSIQVRLRESEMTEPAPGAQPLLSASLRTTSITLDGRSQTVPPLRLVADGGNSVIITVDGLPEPATQWLVDGSAFANGPTLSLPLDGGQTRTVRAIIPGQTVSQIDGYFRFDHPPIANVEAFSVDPVNTSADQAINPSASAFWKPPARQFLPTWRQVLSRVSPKTITIKGSASYDGDDQKAKYNYLLSQRRARGLKALIDSDPFLAGFTVTQLPVDIIPVTAQPANSWKTEWMSHGEPREQWWRARIEGFSVALPGPVIDGEVRRPTAPEPPDPFIETPPDPSTPPSWFRQARLKVRIVQDQFVALELSGQVDFQTALEDQIDSSGADAISDISGMGNNPADGITDFLFLYQTDPASQTHMAKLYIGADPNDRDGLLMTGQLPGQALQAPNTARNILGMTTVFTPLLAEIAPANPADGGIVPILLSGAVIAVPSALAELRIDGEPLLNVERVVLFGGEGSYRRVGDRWEFVLLFDVETAISMKLKLGDFTLLEIPRDTPLAVRYKAIGIKFGEPPGSTAAWELRPVFDQSKGYSIDVSGPGQVKLLEPLNNIVQVVGARIARTNPLNFEIDLGFTADLGVITVDRARVRLPLNPLGPPELTAFGAGLKVPGVLEGHGYMEMNNSDGMMEIKGGLDVSLIPIKLRIAAQIAVAQIPASKGGPATGVAIALEVELPVAIPLAQSGFGIYGFLGLFAMHYGRDETGINSLTPALTWLKDRAKGDPTNLQAWKPEIDRWAFGAGITLGTMGSPVIFNVKGMFLLELPGPRILLMVKANLLAVLPELRDAKAEGTFMCVIDLDFGRGMLSIGLSVDFTIKPLLEIKIPIEAFFNLKSGSDWHIYLGTFPGNDLQDPPRPMPGPIRIKILEVFDGSGYTMVSGHGIPSYRPAWSGSLPALPAVQGTALAAGLEVSIVWGNTSINLYLRVTAGFNAVLGFEPFYVGGLLYLRGELKLFIVSLSASAELAVQVGQKVTTINGVEVKSEIARIDGEVCGELDLFFFTLKGCVDFHLGEENRILPPAPKLITAASLVGRSPALAVGTGTDRKIDAKIGDAVQQSGQPGAGQMPVVPIDAIPVIVMSATPRDDELSIFGEAVNGSSGAPADGFIKRGDFSYRYDLKEVRLETADGSPAIGEGSAPAVWWTANAPADTNISAHLALLDWVPNPTPKALERTEFQEQNVLERWGTICNDSAPAAPVLWTFKEEPLGPSETGWRLNGTPWPDPDNTERSEDPDTRLDVRETWRTGNRELDRQRGIIPAIVQGGKVRCMVRQDPQKDPQKNPQKEPLRNLDIRRLPDNRIAAGPLADLIKVAQEKLLVAAPKAVVAEPKANRAVTLGTGVEPRRFRQRLAEESALLAEATAGSTMLRRVERLDVAAIEAGEIIARLSRGEAIHRASLASVTSEAIAVESRNPGVRECDGRVLAAPLWDIGQPVAFGDRSQSDRIAKELDRLGHKHGPLSDVIELKTGDILEGHVLLFVNRSLVAYDGRSDGYLRLHYVDGGGNLLAEQPVHASDLLPDATLPARWLDASGPWLEDIYHAVLYGNTLSDRHPAIVPLKPPAGTQAVRIGLAHADSKMEQMGRGYYIAAIEATRRSEAVRHDWDETQITRNRSVVESFLGPESGDVALMMPGKTYKITTVTDVKVKDDTDVVTNAPQQVETFWFRTDANAPARLDPWMLCTLPEEKEQHVFGHENVKLVFNTNDVDKLYAAYGKELRARLKAASFRQVNQPGVQHPFPIVAATLQTLGAIHLSPFEAVLTELMAQAGPCIPVDENRARHSMVEIPIPLDPYTDYLLDIEAVDIGAPASARGELVLRKAFSTGGFSSTENFATEFAAVRTEHRAVAAGALQAVAAQFAGREPQGPELDSALIAAGLEPMPVPDQPRIVIFWAQANAAAQPAPVAVMIDAPEPLRRLRSLPVETWSSDATPVRRLEMRAQEWLSVAEGESGDGIIDRLVWAPGGQRLLIALKPGARGKILHVDLVRKAFPLEYLDGNGASDASFRILSETLRRAPWEEED